MSLKTITLLVLSITATFYSAMAQTNDSYSAQWKKVTTLEKKGLTASALKEVIGIYQQALKDKNDAQQIKTSMYQIRYRNMMLENSQENNIFFVDTLIAKAKVPAKNILQSMQAEMMWQYLQNHRWQIYNRTQLKEEKSKDISTWSIDKLQREIAKRYKSSVDVSTAPILKLVKTEAFDAVIIKGENSSQLRPTLYDFLVFRALDYFMTNENDITKPAYYFTINDPAAFAPAEEFAQHDFDSKDTASLHFYALQLLKQVLTWHMADMTKDALLDADLIRLNFVYQYAVNKNKLALYETALKNIEDKFPENAATAQAMYLRAKIYYEKGQDYDALTKTANQYEIKRAKELCETAIKKYPKSEGGINAQNLLKQILQPSLSLETEKVNLPNQPFRTLLKYKNIPGVYFRLIKTTRDEIINIDTKEYAKIWQSYTAMKPVRSWSQALPDPLDYQEHATEIKIDAADNGMYFLLASVDKNFALDKNIMARQITYISNISYIHNNVNDYYVLNRDNGQPLANTKVQVWNSNYNYNASRYECFKAEQYSTDKDGHFKLKTTKEFRNINLQLINGKDELFMDDNLNGYIYNSYQQPEQHRQAFLFTDRSIYRPGQTIYFKGIVISKNAKAADSKVMPSFNSVITLRDANGQKINELKMTTNEYGSYHGSFKLPEESLNGQFSLYDSAANGYYNFSVEEYKRPKFSVEVKKPSGTYRVNDSITVTGFAKAYAGNNVDGAEVEYRVVRKIQYPLWWDGGFIRKGRGRIFPPGKNEEVEISNGTITTDSKGLFNITFKALPDESIDKKDQPTFYYEVSGDVTDLNGETRSGETSVAVSYQALQLTIDLADKINADSLHTLKVRSANTNDVFEKAGVNIHVEKLQHPGKIFRERYWQMPDQFVMSRDEYYSLFPYDVYKDEDDVSKWTIAQSIIEVKDSTKENEGISLRLHKGTPEGKLLPGWYKITATTHDKYGEEVKAEKYVQVLGKAGAVGTQALNENEGPVTINKLKEKAEPGEKISYDIRSGFGKIWLIHTLSRMNDVNETKVIETTSLPSAQPMFVQELTEADRGGMAINYAFVKHNRVYSGNESFEIPWSNKELAINYQSFRDKLLPGENEKWTVTISGDKGEKVAAEMLAGMYDASLDQFKDHGWGGLNIWPKLINNNNWNNAGFESIESANNDYAIEATPYSINKSYDLLGTTTKEGIVQPLWWLNPLDYAYRNGNGRGRYAVSLNKVDEKSASGKVFQMQFTAAAAVRDEDRSAMNGWATLDSTAAADGDVVVDGEKIKVETNGTTQIRKNFNETAFFFHDLTTDADGHISFNVTIPEALTKWKLMTLAHTKDLKSSYTEKTLVTQKPLMVQPNAPRFMREGDQIIFTAKIVNLSDSALTGTASLALFDAATNQPVDGLFNNNTPVQNFTTMAGQSTVVKYAVKIPVDFNSALSYRIIARANNFSDGEEMSLPILTNRTLVTETLPLNIRNTTNKKFAFEKLLNSAGSKTISNHALTVEYTSNPVWYAVQALPYLMEYPYECAEQTFNRYYANTLAAYVSNATPKLKAVFEKWKTFDTTELLSNLQKNEELKSALLQETPWILEAQHEAQQKKNIAMLFDLVKMSSETGKQLDKLKEMQSENGGFVWFKGGPDDRYITQYIVTGIGHLKKLQALSVNESNRQKDIMGIVKKAIPYLDKKIKEDYDWLIKNKVKLQQNNLSNTVVQYLYMRSFFTEIPVAAASQQAVNYFKQQARQYWLSNGKYMQAMVALALYRDGDIKTPKAIVQSLKENAINNETLGMYWKDWNNRGWFWHQAPIESQALMIEAFTAIDKNERTIDELKTWLLQQKQTQNWGTTKATAEACYALLLNGSNWIADEKAVTINLGSTTIKSNNESGATGYFKERIEGKDVQPEMGKINVTVQPLNNSSSTSGSWGSVYWQYFEDLDKITTAATPLKLVKKLFIERNTATGPVLDAIEDGAALKVGDKVKVRIELRVDRDMEYVHMKDMRAACMEPVNVISGYQYQDGLGYYESTKDASTNFFFNWLNKGSYVFEYSLFVTHAGNFSNGITSIQCMYAPEFTSHSDGIRVTVEEQ